MGMSYDTTSIPRLYFFPFIIIFPLGAKKNPNVGFAELILRAVSLAKGIPYQKLAKTGLIKLIVVSSIISISSTIRTVSGRHSNLYEYLSGYDNCIILLPISSPSSSNLVITVSSFDNETSNFVTPSNSFLAFLK